MSIDWMWRTPGRKPSNWGALPLAFAEHEPQGDAVAAQQLRSKVIAYTKRYSSRECSITCVGDLSANRFVMGVR